MHSHQRNTENTLYMQCFPISFGTWHYFDYNHTTIVLTAITHVVLLLVLYLFLSQSTCWLTNAGRVTCITGNIWHVIKQFPLIYRPCLLAKCKSDNCSHALDNKYVLFSNYQKSNINMNMHAFWQERYYSIKLEPLCLRCRFFITYHILFHQLIIYVSIEIASLQRKVFHFHKPH